MQGASCRGVALLLCGCLMGRGATAQAGRCAPIEGGGPALARLDPELRLGFLRRQLQLEARRVRIWSWTWASLYGAAAIAQVASLPARDPGERVDAYLGAAGAGVGVAVLAIAPKRILRDQRRLEHWLGHGGVAASPCARLAAAELVLLRDARDEAFGKSGLVHAGSFVFNLALGLVLALGLRHFETAAISVPIGVAVGELQILSQPSGAITALERYRAARLVPVGPVRSTARGRWLILPQATPASLGLWAGGTF